MADIIDQAQKATRDVQKTADEAREKIERGMQRGSEWATHVAGAGADQAKDAMSDARARGERASDFVSDEARRFSRDESAWTDQAADAASRVSRSIHDHGREAKAQVAGLADELGQMVREQPLLVLSIAGVVGYMTAYIVHGRR